MIQIWLLKNTLGKCTDGKTIYINPELMQYKREIIEYVVVHEFCHIKYKTHGKKFYEIIEKNIIEITDNLYSERQQIGHIMIEENSKLSEHADNVLNCD